MDGWRRRRRGAVAATEVVPLGDPPRLASSLGAPAGTPARPRESRPSALIRPAGARLAGAPRGAASWPAERGSSRGAVACWVL